MWWTRQKRLRNFVREPKTKEHFTEFLNLFYLGTGANVLAFELLRAVFLFKIFNQLEEFSFNG
jgi:hypothetical protein